MDLHAMGLITCLHCAQLLPVEAAQCSRCLMALAPRALAQCGVPGLQVMPQLVDETLPSAWGRFAPPIVRSRAEDLAAQQEMDELVWVDISFGRERTRVPRFRAEAANYRAVATRTTWTITRREGSNWFAEHYEHGKDLEQNMAAAVRYVRMLLGLSITPTKSN